MACCADSTEFPSQINDIQTGLGKLSIAPEQCVTSDAVSLTDTASVADAAAATARFCVKIMTRDEIAGCPAWAATFADRRKDHRYYEILAFSAMVFLHPMKPEHARGLHHPGGLGSADRKARTCSQFSAAPLGLRASIRVEEPCTPTFGTN